MGDLRMKLDPEPFPRLISHGGHRTVGASGKDGKSPGHSVDSVSVAHPHRFFLALSQAIEEIGIVHDGDHGMAIFTVVRFTHHTVKKAGHILHSVAYSKDWHVQFKDSPVGERRVLLIDAGRALRKE